MVTEPDPRDEEQWRDETNWHWSHQIYSSKVDSRLIVPKWHDPATSRTLNLGRRVARLALAMLLLPLLLACLILAFGVR